MCRVKQGKAKSTRDNENENESLTSDQVQPVLDTADNDCEEMAVGPTNENDVIETTTSEEVTTHESINTSTGNCNTTGDETEPNSNFDDESEEELEIEGRRIVDIFPFMKQLHRISLHNDGYCSFSELKIVKEIRIGLHSKIVFTCNECKRSFRVYTNDDEKTTDTIDINASAVLAANMIGIGYSQLEQLTSILDVPVMCNDKFKNLNDEMGDIWEGTADECMRQAAEEEARAATERGEVDPIDGIPFITVVTDGTWSKRSYNKNFTALSGVGAIVGAHTGKVLWIGVKNKYCVTCVRAFNKGNLPAEHLCTRNFTGPSSEMEWETILEGFKSSVELYNLRYLKVIADGDSSTYAKLLQHKPYGDRHIEKIECTNHLHRNFRRNIEAAVKGCLRGLNKHVIDNLERIRKDVCSAVQFRKSEDTTENEKISLLKSDLNNVLHHVFGDHDNCPAYIKGHCKDDHNYVPALVQCNTFEKMSATMRQLMYCAKDLIRGENNNPAEHYNSIVAKFVGGKRVNFSLSNSYKFKANVAAVQFNTKSALSTFYNFKFKKPPPELARKLELKRLRIVERAKERRGIMKKNKIMRTPFCRLRQSGSGYGPDSQKPDLSPEDFDNEKKIHFSKLAKYNENRSEIEENTRSKEQCNLWNEIVPKIILSQNFGSICKARTFGIHVKELTSRKTVETKAMRHQRESRPIALQQLRQEQNIPIRESGLYIDQLHNFLAASPTGIVIDSDTIVDIRCPLAITNMDPNDHNVLAKLDFIETTKETGLPKLKKNHQIYFDIQGQLHICNKRICLFSIWTSNRHKMFIDRVERDDEFFEKKMKTQLHSFYNDWLTPELINPRLSRGMPIREPIP